MASFASSSYSSSGATTHLLEETPIIIRNLTPAPKVLENVDDVSIIEAVPGDLDTDKAEDISGSYCYDGDMYCPTLAQDYYTTARLSVDVIRLDAEHVSVENVVSEKRLSEALQGNCSVTFINLGSGYEDDSNQVTLAAMQMILTKYRVSPLFLEGGSIPHLGGVGIGVRSKIIFSDATPNVVCGYHIWYSLPLRMSLWSAASPTASSDDTPTVRKHAGYTTIPLSMRMYMTYNHIEGNSVNILFPPHGTDSTATLRRFLSHSTPLDLKVDPFGVHLLYLSRAVIDWRKVLQDITNELTHHERASMVMTQHSSLEATHQLHSLAIIMARIGSEMRITVDILYGLQRAHNEFYDMVLKNHDKSSRSPIYHRLQSDFRNLAETFNSRLVEVVELESRIRNCFNSLFNMLHLQHCSHGPARVATI